MLEVFKKITYEEYDINQIIFHYGDIGHKLYIDLDGEAFVLTPYPGRYISPMMDNIP